MSILRKAKSTLPSFIHTLREKGKPAVWLPQDKALNYERLRLHGNDRHFMMIDYDVYDKKTETYKPIVNHDHYDIDPNIVVYNSQSGNHQAFWWLKDPVHCQDTSKTKAPYQYLRAIESAYDAKYGGDISFGRYISRNPFCPFSDTDWRHDTKHSLSQLAEVVELNKSRVKSGDRDVAGSGRNCDVFDGLRVWAYKQDSRYITYPVWQQRLLTKAVSLNTYREPMNLNEVHGIAKSVAQYTYNKPFAESFEAYVAKTHTSEIQAKRGAIGGKKSKRKPVVGSAKSTKPWESMGISRATYYRRGLQENETG